MPHTLVELEGCNGQWFTLSGPGAGEQGVYLGTDVEGIYDAPVKTIYTEHAHQIGASYADMRHLRRDIVFGLVVEAGGGRSWEENDSEIRKAFSYTDDAKLWVETENSRRYLKIRLGEQPLFKPDFDPNQSEVDRVVMTCVAGDPWWYEDDFTDSWVASGATGSGTVTVGNPTDQEIWAKWTLQGPARWVLPDFSWGDDRFGRAVTDASRQISMPLMASGAVWKVDSDPFEDQLRDEAGSQVWALMNGVTFNYPIPAYTPPTEVPVSVTSSTAGAGIQVRCPRTWSRPWGLQ